ncbi:MAG: type II toxin-antitoxin system VapB family antitoxin [Parvularculaceae bacterium]
MLEVFEARIDNPPIFTDIAGNMKTTIDIPDALLAEAQELARREGTTLKALTTEALRKVIAEKGARMKKFKLRDCSFHGDGLSDEFKNASWEQIRDAIYEGRG